MKAVSCLLLTKPVIYGSVLDSVEDFCCHGYVSTCLLESFQRMMRFNTQKEMFSVSFLFFLGFFVRFLTLHT